MDARRFGHGADIEHVDAIVVGAGPNGLTAATVLARAGREVLVLEAQDHLGGAVHTAELTLPGFKHDVFSAVYPAAAASPVFEELELERHGLRWVHPEIALCHVIEDRGVPLFRDLGATVEALDGVVPGDGQRWGAFASTYLRRFRPLRDTLLSGFPPVKGPAGLAATLGPQGTLDFARLVLTPARVLARRLFEDDGAQAWLFGQALHGDTPPAEPGSGIAGAYLALVGHRYGWPSPAGGAGELARALVRACEAAGGRCRTGARVVRLLTEGGRVTGAEIEGGEAVRAPVVVCDLVPRGLLAVAGDALPARYRDRLVEYRHGSGSFKMDWALDGPVPWTSERARRAGTVHVGGSAREVADAVREGTQEGRLPERPFLLFGQQTVADPTRAPEGRHTAWAYTHIPPDADWDAHRERFADAMEQQVERFAPGFRERILARHVMDPRDLERRNANLIGGDVGAGSYAMDQLVFRPVPSLSPYRTPVRGLYLGSAATFPGGAVHGVPGRAAARAVLADQLVRRVPRRAVG